jgi:hypothetical protein
VIGEVYTGFLWGNVRKRDNLKEQGIDFRIILRWIFRKWDGDMDWIELAQDRDRWRALVKCGNEPSGSIKMWRVSWLAANRFACQEGLYYIEKVRKKGNISEPTGNYNYRTH